MLGGTGVTFAPNADYAGAIGIGFTALPSTYPQGKLVVNGAFQTVSLEKVVHNNQLVDFSLVNPNGAPPPSGTPTTGLFFDLQADTIRTASPKKVFAHYFPPYPVSLDNKDPSVDYYTTGYLNIHGESNSHQAYGGFHRNRPMGRAPVAGDYVTADIQTEIMDARNAGLDGFAVDLLSASGNNWTRAAHLVQVAGSLFPDGSFKVIPMVDTTASYTTAQSVSSMSDQLNTFATSPSAYYLPDGRFVVSSFKGETYNASWWNTLFTDMKTRHGLNVAFLAGFLNISAWSNYQGYPWSYGAGDWGDGADPGIAATTGASEHSTAVYAAGWKWMQPVQTENVRPNQHVFDEAKGTASLRGWWDRAIRNNANYVQLVTWSDYSESGSIQNSVTSGNVGLDISSYYIYKWKTGNWPTILKDAIYLSHRAHFSNATYRSAADGQTQWMSHWQRGSGMSAVVDIVEVVTYMTASASVTVMVGNTPHTFTAPAGMSVTTFPLGAGTISATATRSGTTVASVTSPVAVTTTPYKDEWIYYRFSSIRGTTGQYNPNLA